MNGSWKRKITLFLGTQTISLFGSMLVQYAIMWHITLTTQSGAMMTIAIICGFLPTFFLSPFAGVWADRYNRKRLIILADALIAVATLLLALLFLAGYKALWLFFLISAVRSVGGGIQTPAISALLPDMVPEEKLTKVNATQGTIQAFVMLVSPMVSGALLSVASIESILFIDVVTAAIAILSLLTLVQVPVHAKAKEKQSTSYLSDLRDGFAYMKSHSYVKAFFLHCAIFFLLAAPAAFLTPLQVTRSFGDQVWRLTAIEITFSIGMMAGGGLMAAWGGFPNRVHTMSLSSVLIGACTVALGVPGNFWLYLLFMALIGVALSMFNTPSTVLLQERVEADYLGRVFGVMSMIQSSMMPLGMLLFGPIADLVRIEWLLISTGSLIFVQGFLLMGTKALVEAGRPAAPEVI